MQFKKLFTQEVSGQYLLDLPKDYAEKTNWPLAGAFKGDVGRDAPSNAKAFQERRA